MDTSSRQRVRLSAREAMEMAIKEAAKGAGFVSPNPLVGCVIVDKDYRHLATGYHARLGDLHAETHALAQIQDVEKLKGAHVFVTLEPCAHEGRQPSCAKHLARLPIASVTYVLEDPNPLVSGQGAEILRRAGIRVERLPELESQCEELTEIFLFNMRRQRPFVALKVASSLDGQVALTSGESQWITGAEARAHVQRLRGEYDAVLTGAGTFLRDDPGLNSRDPRFAAKASKMVLLDPDGLCLGRLAQSKAARVRRPEDLIVVSERGKAAAPMGFAHIELDRGEVNGEQRLFHLLDLLHELKRRNVHSLMVEAGPVTASSFFAQRLVDRLYLFLAPRLIGRGLSWTSGWELNSLSETVGLAGLSIHHLGPDLLLSGRPDFSAWTK